MLARSRLPPGRRFVPLLPLSREEEQLERLKRNLAIYRVAFGQPRQGELMALIEGGAVSVDEIDSWVVRLEPVGSCDDASLSSRRESSRRHAPPDCAAKPHSASLQTALRGT